MDNKGLITVADFSGRFRASGTYFLVRDNTTSPDVPSNEPIRLIAGFSKNGLFNVPVFIKKGDQNSARRLYGNRDKSLERKGSWFHKSLDVCLDEGSVLALNLLKLNDEVDENGVPTSNADVIDYRSFSTDIATINPIKRKKLYSSFYNKERFWKADKEYLLATRSISDQKSILNFVNLSQSPTTILVKKSSIKGFDVTVKDWYQGGEIPKYLKPTDLISDYFIDVVVLNGNYSQEKYAQLSIDPLFGDYFTTSGLIISKLNEFLSLNEISVRSITSGCLIPNFIDKNGTPQSIETQINSDVLYNGIMVAVDTTELDKFETATNNNYIDLVGHRLLTENVVNTDFLSYKRKLSQDLTYTEKTTNQSYYLYSNSGITVTPSVSKFTVAVSNTNPDFDVLNDILSIGMLFKGVRTTAGNTAGVPVLNPSLEVTKVLKTPSLITFELSNQFKLSETSLSGSFVNLVSSNNANNEIIPIVVGSVITAKKLLGVTTTVLGTYTVQIGDNLNTVLTNLTSDVNTNTGTTGCSAVNTNPTIKINSITDNDDYIITVNVTDHSILISDILGEGIFEYVTAISAFEFESENNRFYITGDSNSYIAEKNSQSYVDYSNGSFQSGDKINDGTNNYYAKLTEVYASSNIFITSDYRKVLKIELFTDSDLTIPYTPVIAFGDSFDSNGYQVSDTTKIDFISLIGSINQRFPTTIVNQKIVRVPIAYKNDIKVGQFLNCLDSDQSPILGRILRIKNYTESPSLVPTHLEIECDNQIKEFISISGDVEIERYVALQDMYTTFDLTLLSGFTMKETHMPNGTNQRMKEIYSVMTTSNLSDALVDPEMINFRYLVDTFNHGLEPESKSYLSRFVMRRQRCLGLLNTPTLKEFKASLDPRFTSTPTPSNPLPTLDTELILSGGNLDENPTFLYTLPSENNGASFVGYFFPNVEILENDNSVIEFPPAPLVSNNYIIKYRSNPFKAVAGSNRGVLSISGENGSISGVTYALTKDQRGALEQKGINPIIKKQNGNVQIQGQDTAYKKFKSILNNIHARDTLIGVELDLDVIIPPNEFEYNDDTLKTVIESSLKTYFDNLRDVYSAIRSYSIVFDRTNNPDWLVREGAALIDIELELQEVVKKFIARITLTRGSNPIVGSFTAI